jgi:hypothetical protein
MWLRDAFPLDFPNARVLIYGYDTQLVRSSSFQNLTDLGRALQIDMKGIRVIAPRISSQICTVWLIQSRSPANLVPYCSLDIASGVS